MMDAGENSIGTFWRWLLATPIIAILVLHLPWLVMVGVNLLLGSNMVYERLDLLGIEKVLFPIYEQTILRLRGGLSG